MIATKLVPPHDIQVDDSYFVSDLGGWKGSHPILRVEIPRSGMKMFGIDEECVPLIGDLWDSNVYTTECCQKGYVCIDKTRGTMKELNEWQQALFFKGLVSKHLPKFALGILSEMPDRLIITWDKWMNDMKTKEDIRSKMKWLL